MLGSSRLVTADELEGMREDARFELWNGRLVPMNPPARPHGRIVIRLGSLLDQHVRAHGLGQVTAEIGVKLHANPDTVFGPDLTFIRNERLPQGPSEGYWDGAPDLAVEILSPGDRPGTVRRKIGEYLLRGTTMVLVIDPRRRTATIHRPERATLTLTSEATLDLSEIVDGFTCRVSAIFE